MTAAMFGFSRVFQLLLPAAVLLLSFCRPHLARLTEDAAISTLASGLFVNEDIVVSYTLMLHCSIDLGSRMRTSDSTVVRMHEFCIS